MPPTPHRPWRLFARWFPGRRGGVSRSVRRRGIAPRRGLVAEGLEDRRLLAAGWPLAAGGAAYDFGSAVATLPDGSSVVVGHFEGTATFGDTTLTSSGESDVVIARVDGTGTVLWAIRAGGAGVDKGTAIARVGTSSAVIVTGTFDTSADFGPIVLATPPLAPGRRMFVAKVTADGAFAWATRTGDAGLSGAAAVATLPDGSALVTGSFRDTASFGATTLASAGDDDLFLARINAAGQFAWARRAGGTGTDAGTAVAVGSGGAIALAGTFQGSATFGTAPIESAGGTDAVFARVTAGGAFGWIRRAGGAGDDRPGGIAVAPDGSFVATGSFHGSAGFGPTTLESVGSSDAFVTRLSWDGSFTWARRVGGSDLDVGTAVARLPGGSFLVAGVFEGSVAFGDVPLASDGPQGFVARITAAGTFLWASAVDATSSNKPNAIAPLADGSALLTGSFLDTATLGQTTLLSVGASDLFLAKITADGSFDLPPGTPLQVKGKAGDGQVALSWTPPIADGSAPVTNYVVQFRPANQRVPVWLGGFEGLPSALPTATVTGLTNGVPYLFRVRAENAAGTSSFSAPSGPLTPRAVPGAPTGIKGLAGDGAATIAWKAPPAVPGAPITGFTVQSSTDLGATWTTVAAKPASTGLTVTGLANGIQVLFRVAATNASGTGPFSLPSAAITPFGVPGVPEGFSAVGESGAVALSWSAPESDGGRAVTAYRIRYARQIGAGVGAWKTLERPADLPTSHVLTGIPGGHTYRFRIAAVNLRGAGAFTSPDHVAEVGVLVDTNFSAGAGGWSGNVADLPQQAGGATYDLAWGSRALPSEVGPGKGFMLQGHNRSDDLFLHLARRLGPADGIVAGASYVLSYTITLASNAPSNAVGIGGAPGEGVHLKAGGSGVAPRRIVDADGWWRLNVDKGNQSQGGNDATVAGNIANGREAGVDEEGYVSIVRAVTHAVPVKADAQGRLWLLVGIDSGFEGLTRIYLERITVRLERLRA